MISHRKPAVHLAIGCFAVAAVPLLLLVDAAVAMLRGWRTISRLDYAVLALAMLVVLAAALGLAWGKGQAFFRRRGADLLLLNAALWGSWLAAEGIAALFFRPRSPEELLLHGRLPRQRYLFRPDPKLMPGVFGESRYSTNSLGVRGPELPPREAAYRILCLGGSTTECVYLDDEETWPHLLMVRLNEAGGSRRVWVGNSGISGFSTVQHRKFVERSTLMREIDCLLILVGVNDVSGFLMGRRAGPWRPAVAAAYEDDQTRPWAPFWQGSGILNLLRVAWHQSAGTYHVEDAGGSNYEPRRRRRAKAPLRDQLPPGLEEELRDYAAEIRAIAEICRQRGVRPVFASQPVLWDNSLSEPARALLWLGWVDKGRYLSVERLRQGMDRYNETLLRTCDQIGVECIDLSSLSGKEQLFYDDCHYNEAGCRVVAGLMADWFLSAAAVQPLRRR